MRSLARCRTFKVMMRPAMILPRVTAVAMAVIVALMSPPRAQAQLRVEPSASRFWLGGLALTGAAVVLDRGMREIAAHNQSSALDDLARDVDPLGRARYLVPALVGAYLVPRLAGRHRLSDAVLRIGMGYAVTSGMVSVLKPAIGRHRPDARGDPSRFHPFSTGEEWHSLPSGHTSHAFAIAAGIADEARNPWVTGVAYGAASLVGIQRIYTSAHWTSDVVASSILAISASTTTVRWLRHRGAGRLPAPADSAPNGATAWSLTVAPRRIVVSRAF